MRSSKKVKIIKHLLYTLIHFLCENLMFLVLPTNL